MPLTKEQRAEISRANGRNSRGPKTARGKYFSSRNALKHGFSSKIEEPDFPEVLRLCEEHVAALVRPCDEFEKATVHEMAIARARMWLVSRVENQYLAAAASAIEFGTIMAHFDRYSWPADKRYRRLTSELWERRRRKKSEQNEPGVISKKQSLMKNEIPGGPDLWESQAARKCEQNEPSFTPENQSLTKYEIAAQADPVLPRYVSATGQSNEKCKNKPNYPHLGAPLRRDPMRRGAPNPLGLFDAPRIQCQVVAR